MVISLSLMVLLTVLAVGLLSLSSISLRASSQSDAMQLARSNARMALSLAIGQLQKTAGPDQRITAPASVESDTAPSWMAGVWSGKLPTASEPSPSKSSGFLGYLASGTENLSAQDPAQVPDTTTGTVLLGEGSLGKGVTADQVVRAKKIETPGSGKGLRGGYSWGILDEGTKAKVDIVRTAGNFGTAQNQAAMGAPARFGLETMEGLDTYDWFKSTEQGRIFTLPTASLIDEMPELKEHQHEVTTVHRGLVTDAARGGLRKDLSLLFGAPTLAADYSNKRVYDDATVLAETPNPYWTQLFEYSSLYRNLGTGSTVKANVPSGYNPVKYDPRSRTYKTNPQAPKGLMLMPVVAKVQMQFSIVAKDAHGNWSGGLDRDTTTAQDNYMIYMIYSPIITLYNPYSVPLTFDELRIDFKDLPVGFRFYRNGQAQTTQLAHFNQLYVSHPTDSGTPKTFGINLRNSFSPSRTGQVVMQPGENRVFGESVSGDSLWNSAFDWQDDLTANLTLGPGYPSQGVGFWVDWLTPQHIRTAADDQQGIFPVSRTDTIDVGFGPMPSTASANRLSIELNLVQGSRRLRSGSLDLDYGDTARLTQALSRDPGTTFTAGEARLQRPYNCDEILQSPNDQLKNFTRAKAFAMFSYYAKTTLESDSPSKPWVQGGHATSLSAIDLTKEDIGIHPFEASLKRLAPSFKFPCDAQNRGKFFTGHSEANGTRIAPQYEIPLLPLQSVAQLRHASLSNQGFLPGATYTVGESFASALIPANAVSATGTKDYKLLDHVWLANNALWDGYFFSTLTPHAGPIMGSRSLNSVAEEFFAGKEDLLNPRIIPVTSGTTAATVADVTSDQGYLGSASHLMIDGAFNVNSTSVGAWRALLASMNKETVEYNHMADGAATASLGTVKEASFPFSRMRRANGPPVESFNMLQARHGRWTGMRTLTEDEIETLATNIVEQVKLRGPFLSLAEFVNRKPGSDKDLAQSGALQTAIDETRSINDRFVTDSKVYSTMDVSSHGYAFAQAMEGMSATGAPGYLTQGDLLSSLGSVISVRSDTFRIRSYGEALDPDNKVVARAWCEAVVQRVPEYIDSSDLPSVAPEQLNEANKQFGRRFVVNGFRWLSPEEV